MRPRRRGLRASTWWRSPTTNTGWPGPPPRAAAPGGRARWRWPSRAMGNCPAAWTEPLGTCWPTCFDPDQPDLAAGNSPGSATTRVPGRARGHGRPASPASAWTSSWGAGRGHRRVGAVGPGPAAHRPPRLGGPSGAIATPSEAFHPRLGDRRPAARAYVGRYRARPRPRDRPWSGRRACVSRRAGPTRGGAGDTWVTNEQIQAGPGRC